MFDDPIIHHDCPSFPYLVAGLEHFLFFHMLGMSSSQLTFIFLIGVGLNHQPDMEIMAVYGLHPAELRLSAVTAMTLECDIYCKAQLKRVMAPWARCESMAKTMVKTMIQR